MLGLELLVHQIDDSAVDQCRQDGDVDIVEMELEGERVATGAFEDLGPHVQRRRPHRHRDVKAQHGPVDLGRDGHAKPDAGDEFEIARLGQDDMTVIPDVDLQRAQLARHFGEVFFGENSFCPHGASRGSPSMATEVQGLIRKELPWAVARRFFGGQRSSEALP